MGELNCTEPEMVRDATSWGLDFTTGLSSRFNPFIVVLLDLTQMLLVHGEVLLENVLNLQLMMMQKVKNEIG